ncbi:hypothetical protein [Halobacterium wangiae]|uniref:hypothetical protein n=1 Tax=Halobacterium wangiae TaxID=2902623 RepID=UPI001E5A3A80|nr:hypothetical protein [Halobacterium wangiae]
MAVLRRIRPVVGAVLLGVVYWVVVRPRMLNWGATPGDVRRTLPGDELLAEPDGESTMGVRIDAPPEAIWPWLRQLGQEQGGFYSYQWAENLVGLDIHNAEEIVPEYQELSVGDTVRLARADRFPETKLEVASFTPERSLVLQSPEQPPWWVWAFVLEPVDETTTRLLVRSRISLLQNPLVELASKTVLDPITFVMTRGMLLGIKSRVEARADADSPVEPRADDREGERPGSGTEDE